MPSSLRPSRYPSASSRRTTHLGLLLLALALTACGGSDPAQAPKLLSTSPGDGAVSVPLNAKLSAAFDQPMAALGEGAFTLKQGTTALPGTVALSADGKTAIFAPSSGLIADRVYTATVSTDAHSSDGTALAAAHSWSFTTGAAADTTAPSVTAADPAADSTGVAINTAITATFSEAMDPLTLTSESFGVKQGSTVVPGSVTYGPGTTATFTPDDALVASVLLDVTLSADIKDLNGNALASAFHWSFTTGTSAALGPAPVQLGTARNYALLAQSGVSSVPTSAVTGDVGVSPAAASYLTGFSLVADATNVFSTSPQIVGQAFAADYAVPTPSNLTTAVGNMQSAYTDAASRPTPDHLELGTGNIGGMTLQPGLYKWTSTVTIPSDVTLSGGANDVWIFQTTGDLTQSAATQITLSGGAQAKNVFWQVAGQAVLGTGSHFEGILLCKTDVTLETGATMNGRVLSQTQIALQQATVSQPE